MDVIYVENKKILHALDIFSRFQFAEILDNDEPDAIVRALQKFRKEGALPQILWNDRDGLLMNEPVTEYLSQFGIKQVPSTAKAPWSLGLAERHGGVLKHLLAMYRTEYGNEEPLELIVREVVAQKNEQPLGAESMFKTPYELWFGRKPASVTLHITNPTVGDLPTCLRKEEERRFRVRDLVNGSRARRLITEALRRQLKPERTPLAVGDNVYFYTESDRHGTKSGWRGPAKLVYFNEPDRQAVVEYEGRFFSRSSDLTKPFSDVGPVPEDLAKLA